MRCSLPIARVYTSRHHAILVVHRQRHGHRRCITRWCRLQESVSRRRAICILALSSSLASCGSENQQAMSHSRLPIEERRSMQGQVPTHKTLEPCSKGRMSWKRTQARLARGRSTQRLGQHFVEATLPMDVWEHTRIRSGVP